MTKKRFIEWVAFPLRDSKISEIPVSKTLFIAVFDVNWNYLHIFPQYNHSQNAFSLTFLKASINFKVISDISNSTTCDSCWSTPVDVRRKPKRHHRVWGAFYPMALLLRPSAFRLDAVVVSQLQFLSTIFRWQQFVDICCLIVPSLSTSQQRI